jgi:hypothetical protein
MGFIGSSWLDPLWKDIKDKTNITVQKKATAFYFSLLIYRRKNLHNITKNVHG